jgi:uroporphyrinogen III methyltransferase/synthase
MVFTSANGVRIFFEEMSRRKMDIRRLGRMKFACIGPGTAALLEEKFLYADLVPAIYTAEALAEELAKTVLPGEKVLILRAQVSNPILTKTLEREKIQYKDCKIYNVQYLDRFRPGEDRKYAYVVFASAGGVRSFLSANEMPEGAEPVCIGGSTAGELERLTGLRGTIADECTVQGILHAIVTHHGSRK